MLREREREREIFAGVVTTTLLVKEEELGAHTYN